MEEHGLKSLISILKDLQAGVMINDALGRHTGGLEAFEASFRSFLNSRAADFATAATFDEIPPEILTDQDLPPLEEFLSQHPTNVPARLQLANRYLESSRPDLAEAQLREIIQLVPDDVNHVSARTMLARLYRQQNKPDDALAKLDLADDDAFAALYQELRGDIKLSQNDRAATRTAYEKAMALGPAPASKDLLQRKLDDLAGAQS